MPPPPRAVALATAIAVTALSAAACGDGAEPTTSPSATDPDGTGSAVAPSVPDTAHPMVDNPAAAATGPGIDAFEAPPAVACGGDGPAQVPVRWSAPAATVVRFLVDGEAESEDRPPVGEGSVAVPCDGTVHVLVLAAVDEGTDPTVRSVAVLTEPEG